MYTLLADQVQSLQQMIPAPIRYKVDNGVELIDALGERAHFPLEFCHIP